MPAESETQLVRKPKASWRLPVSITVKQPQSISLATIALSQKLKGVQDRIDNGPDINIVPNTDLKRWRYPDLGINLLTTDEILGIALFGEHAPMLRLLGTELGAKAPELHLGMRLGELASLLLDERVDCDWVPFADPQQKEYMFYPDPTLYRKHGACVDALESCDQARPTW